MTFDVFISYKRITAKDFAQSLKVGLEDSGIHAFLDLTDIPEKVQGEEQFRDAIDKAIVQSKTFILIMTRGFEKSKDVARELSLARKSGRKEFVYLKYVDLPYNSSIELEDGKLDFSKRQQTVFCNDTDLVRQALRILAKDYNPPTSSGEETELSKQKKLLNAIANFGALYDQKDLYATKRPEKLYPHLFSAEEMNAPGKSAKIYKILLNFLDNPQQLKEALKNIIDHHPKEYSIKNLGRIESIVADLGFRTELVNKNEIILVDVGARASNSDRIARATQIMQQLQAFIDEKPQMRMNMLELLPCQEWIRTKALELNRHAVSAKSLIGTGFDMDQFRVNPDIVTRNLRDAWGHLQSLAAKLQGEIEAFKAQAKR
jgi:hypothetical protein